MSGRKLRVPSGRSVRPTSDRVREALFAALGDLDGCRVLDLFAGSGSLGAEALSRGASFVVFVERDGRTAKVLRANLDALFSPAQYRVLKLDARTALGVLRDEGVRAHLAFLDPPYASRAHEGLADELRHVMTPEGLLVLERSVHSPAGPEGVLPPFVQEDERRYGDTVIRRFRPPRELKEKR